MVNFYGLSNIFAAFTNLAIVVFVYIKGRSGKLGRIWAVFTLGVAIYGVGAFMASGARNSTEAFAWWQFSYVGVIMLPVLFIHFVYTFLEINRPRFIRFLYILSFALLAADIFSKKLFLGNVSLLFLESDWFSPAWWVYPPGPLHIFHTLAMYVGLLTYSLTKLLIAYKKADSLKRNQIKYFSIAMILGFVGGGTSYLPCFGINLYPVLNATVPLYTFIIAYAIVRHQLMDIEVIVKRTLVFAGLFAAAFVVLVLPTLLIQEFIVSQMGTAGRIIGLTLSAVLIVLILKPLEGFLVRTTDKFLFQKKYDYKQLLKTFTTEVLTVLDKDILVHTTVDRLSNVMKIRSSGVLLYDKIKNQYDLVASVGIGRDWQDISLKPDHTLVSFLRRTGTYLSAAYHGKDSPIPADIIEDMNRLKMELAFPLIIHDEMIGILTLGKKKSDEDYAQDDLDILFSLARTLAIAISNAMVLDELTKTQAEAAQREKMAVIGTLSAGINHEICNPLGIARGQCEAFLLNKKEGLYRDKTTDDLLKKAETIMKKVIHETDRATAITKRLSSFAKPPKGLYTDDIDIKEEVDEVLTLVGYEMKLDKIEVENKVPENLPHLIGDKKQIQEVFFNLIRNAAQAIEEKGKIQINAYSDNGRIYIEVRDTGQGIPQDKMNQIFNPFFTTKEPGKGTGLGLFIVRQVIERNKGRIAVESTPGVGTKFSLEFPAAEKAKV